MKRTLVAAFVCLLLVAATCHSVYAQPDTLTVPGDKFTIDLAIADLDNGDVIIIDEDAEILASFTLNKDISIEPAQGIFPEIEGGVVLNKGHLKGLTIRWTTGGATFALEAGVATTDDVLIEDCTIKSTSATYDIKGVLYQNGAVTFKGCTFDSVRYLAYPIEVGSSDGTLRFEDCLVRTEHGVSMELGGEVEIVNSTILSVFDEQYGANQGFGYIADAKIMNSIIGGFDTVFQSSYCPSDTVQHNIFYDYTTLGCSIDTTTNLVGVDPLFCEGRESKVGEYSLRIDSPAVPANNSWGENIGRHYGVECAWGTLARDATVAADAEVLVLEDVTVPSGKTLTLAAGAEIHVDEDDDSAGGTDTSLNELIVSGTLDVNGTSGSPVAFTSSQVSPAPLDWIGIRVLSGGVLTMDYASVQHAEYGVRSITDGTSHIRNSSFSNNETAGIHAIGQSSMDFDISDNTIYADDGFGIFIDSDASDGITIEDNTITGTSGTTAGLFLGNGTAYEGMTIKGNTITGCTAGSAIDTPSDATITENTLTGNKWGINVIFGTPAIGTSSSSSDNIIDNNTTGIYCDGSGADPVIRNNKIRSNTYGVQIKSGSDPDLGQSSGDKGNNTLTSNTTYCIWNRNRSGTVSAQYNYFGACEGGAPPVCAYGSVDVTNGLCTAPLGGGRGPALEVQNDPASGFQVLGASPNPMGSGSGGLLHFALEEGAAEVRVQVFNISGRLVRDLGTYAVSAGEQHVHWDGRAESGSPVPGGIYFVRASAGEVVDATAKILVTSR